jgi:predicted  nucleic acid-binding Zn-ribbon protein
METDFNLSSFPGKAIRCSDCGQPYRIAIHEKSSRCPHCGNMEFLPVALVEDRPAGSADPLKYFRAMADGQRVNELLMRYQVEWQLWAKVVENFGDPDFHGAYLTCVISENSFDRGLKRYAEHRAVMVLQRETAWHGEICELMIERLKNIAFVRLEQEGYSRLPLHSLWMLLPWNGRSFRYGFFFLGMMLAGKILFWR